MGRRRAAPFALRDLRAFRTRGYGNDVRVSREEHWGRCGSHSTQDSGVKARLALAGSGVHERLLKPLGDSLQEVVNDPPSLFLQGVEKQPIVAGPWWLLANQHQGTAIEAGLWVKPPMRLGPRQCGRGFPSLERSRPSSRGLAAPVHQCLSGSRPSTFS